MARNSDGTKREAILDAAVVEIARHGYYQTTVAMIARRAGVADGTIYLYFKNKDDILVQFFSYKTKQVFERFREGVDSQESAIEKLRSLIRRHLEAFQQDRNMVVTAAYKGGVLWATDGKAAHLVDPANVKPEEREQATLALAKGREALVSGRYDLVVVAMQRRSRLAPDGVVEPGHEHRHD